MTASIIPIFADRLSKCPVDAGISIFIKPRTQDKDLALICSFYDGSGTEKAGKKSHSLSNYHAKGIRMVKYIVINQKIFLRKEGLS